MCKKNDYGRKAVTVLLAVLTALFALAVMSGSANASSVKDNAVMPNSIVKLEINAVAGETKRSASISKARRKFL